MISFLVANPEQKVTLHWADEVTNPKRVSKCIRFTNDIQPLKYSILPPRSYKTKELWTAGNIQSFLIKTFKGIVLPTRENPLTEFCCLAAVIETDDFICSML